MNTKPWIRKMKFLFVFLLTLVIQQIGYSQNPPIFVCHMDEVSTTPGGEPITAERPPRETDCSRNSSVFNSSFRLQQSYKPTNGQISPATVAKELKLRFVILEKDNTGPVKTNFRPSDIQDLHTIVGYMNDMFSDILVPNNPVTSACGSGCHIADSRIRLKLTEVEFINDATKYEGLDDDVDLQGSRKDSILNVYFFVDSTMMWPAVGFPGQFGFSGGGWAPYLGGNYTNANANQYNFIGVKNTYLCGLYYPMYDPNIDYQGVLWQTSNKLVHEFCHALGLGHLQQDGPGSTGFDPGGCSGSDYLADCFPNSCPMSYSDDYTFNVMNTSQVRNYISPLQLGRIHRSAFMGEISRYLYPVEHPSQHPWIVNTSQTWDFAIRMFQDIVVKSGNTLTITCRVQMPPKSRILVEKGAKLIIDGGNITSYHQKARWNGIELVGDTALTSTAANQGSVELINGGIIENAWNGIRNYTWDNGAMGGGIIKASDAYFYNCWRGVELNNYSKFNYATGNCRFNNVTFLIDDMSAIWDQGGPFAGQFTSWNTKGGVAINNCTFKNEIPYNLLGQHKREEAIVSCSSGLVISGNTFDGFKKGVCANSVGAPPRPTKIYNNTFENITNSIIVGAEAYSDIRNNNIKKMTSYTVYNGNQAFFGSGVGIYLDRTIGSYVACENVVDGVPGSGSNSGSSLNPVGLVANHTHAGGATVLENTFSNIKRGTQTQKNNPKLNIACNTYNNNNVALLVNSGSPNGYVLKNQGTGCANNQVRAGNKFNNNTRDITSYLQTSWNYISFYNPSDPVEFPFNSTSNFANIPCYFPSSSSDPHSQCASYFKCKLVTFPEIAKLKSDFGIIKANGHAFSAEGQLLFGNIVRLYNEADDDAGLISFLEAENDDHARKLLIPLYIWQGNYSSALTAANHLTLPTDEKNAYLSYYNILGTLHYDQRRPDQLTPIELAIVQSLAADELEVSGFAKALLEVGNYEEWIHPVEDETDSMALISYNPENGIILPNEGGVADFTAGSSQLFAAAPNPAQGYTIIRIFIANADAGNNPTLVLHNMTGKEFFKQGLKPGDNYIRINTSDLQSGLYFYSLNVNKRTIKTEKLSIVK